MFRPLHALQALDVFRSRGVEHVQALRRLRHRVAPVGDARRSRRQRADVSGNRVKRVFEDGGDSGQFFGDFAERGGKTGKFSPRAQQQRRLFDVDVGFAQFVFPFVELALVLVARALRGIDGGGQPRGLPRLRFRRRLVVQLRLVSFQFPAGGLELFLGVREVVEKRRLARADARQRLVDILARGGKHVHGCRAVGKRLDPTGAENGAERERDCCC